MLITLGFISSLKSAISRSSPNSLMAGVTGAQKEPNNPRPTCHPPYALWQYPLGDQHHTAAYVTSFLEISWFSTWRQRKWMKKWETINQNRPPTGTYNPRPGCSTKPYDEVSYSGLT
ncbi:hypothetical protein AMTRI_Chr04g252150 [Amborella trichopoda]